MKFILVLFFCHFAFANVSQNEVSQMLDHMVKENIISAEEARKASIKMQGLSAEQWAQINKTANEVAKRSPASVTPVDNHPKSIHQIDLDGAQFKQIQNDLKKIVPESKD